MRTLSTTQGAALAANNRWDRHVLAAMPEYLAADKRREPAIRARVARNEARLNEAGLEYCPTIDPATLVACGQRACAFCGSGAANGMALSLPLWTAKSGNYEGDVPRLRLNYTMAERVLRLMESAQEELARGNGYMARLLARCARDYRRRHFPSRERQARALELEHPCPAVPMPAPAAVEAAYENLYVAHFGADRMEAA